MNVKIITTFENANQYLLCAEHGGAEIEKEWQKYMIAPFWEEIAEWAPFDQSFKQPPRITKLGALGKQLAVLFEIPINDLQAQFTEITKALPSADDDETLVVLYPLCDSNITVRERQNGVVGTSVFGNVIISVNPLADAYEKWISFVFAHEHHHNIWGHNWFVLRGGEGYEGTFLEYIVTEGQADLFAESLFPNLTPQWNRPFGGETEAMLWERIKPVLFSTDPKIHEPYMFGDESSGLPWCMGYSFGKAIVADYMLKHPGISFSDLINIPAKKIFEAGRFSFNLT